MEYASNPKAGFDYEILETIEAGLVLKGYEVKSIKSGKVSLRGAYVKIFNGIPMLVGATISPYQEKNMPETYDAQASRTLLLKKSQIEVLFGVGQTKGFSLIPLKLYNKHGKIKLLIGVARGKKKYDKRETIKKREFERKEKQQFED